MKKEVKEALKEFASSLKTNIDAYPHLFDMRAVPGDYKDNVENLRAVVDEELEYFMEEYDDQ